MTRLIKAIIPVLALVFCSETANAAKFLVTVKGLVGDDDHVTDAEVLVYTGNGFLVNKGEIVYDKAKKAYVVEIDEAQLTAAGLGTVTLEVRGPKRASVRLDLLLGKEDQIIAVALPLMATYQSSTAGGCVYTACTVCCPTTCCEPPLCPPPAPSSPTPRHRFFHKR